MFNSLVAWKEIFSVRTIQKIEIEIADPFFQTPELG